MRIVAAVAIHILRVLAVAAILALLVNPARAMEFRFQEVAYDGQSDTRLVLSGENRPGDAKRLRFFLASHTIEYVRNAQVILDSPGGNVEEAIKLAQVLREVLAAVIVFPPARCASACFFLYVGAASHSAIAELNGVRGGLAVHRPFFAPEITRQLSAEKADAAHSAAFIRARQWLQDQLVPQALIDKLFSLPSTQAYWLTANDIDVLGERAPWYEEWLLSRCPHFVAVEQKLKVTYGTTAYPAAVREFEREASCQAGATQPEQMDVVFRYKRELRVR